jgi:hypothetical protein
LTHKEKHNAYRRVRQAYGKPAKRQRNAELVADTLKLQNEDRDLTRQFAEDEQQLRDSAAGGLAAYEPKYLQAFRTWERLSRVKYERCYNARERNLVAPVDLDATQDITGIQRPRQNPDVLCAELQALLRQRQEADSEVRELKRHSEAPWAVNLPDHADTKALFANLAKAIDKSFHLNNDAEKLQREIDRAVSRFEEAASDALELDKLSHFFTYLSPIALRARLVFLLLLLSGVRLWA